MPVVLNAIKAKESLKLHVAAKAVQKRLRGYIVRRRMHLLNLAVQRVQAYVKMKWHRQFYLKLRTDVMTIQRCVRRFLTRRSVIKERLVTFLAQETSALGRVKQLEDYVLQGT